MDSNPRRPLPQVSFILVSGKPLGLQEDPLLLVLVLLLLLLLLPLLLLVPECVQRIAFKAVCARMC